jgi:hypothetical protein
VLAAGVKPAAQWRIEEAVKDAFPKQNPPHKNLDSAVRCNDFLGGHSKYIVLRQTRDPFLKASFPTTLRVVRRP